MHLVKNTTLPRPDASRNLSQWHLRELRVSSHASAARPSSKPQWNCAPATCCKDSRTPPDCRHPSDPRATSSAPVRVGGRSPAGPTMPDGLEGLPWTMGRAALLKSTVQIVPRGYRTPMPCTSRGTLSPLRMRGRTAGSSTARIRGHGRPAKIARELQAIRRPATSRHGAHQTLTRG